MVRFHTENQSRLFSAPNTLNTFDDLIVIRPGATAIRAGTIGSRTVSARAVVVVYGQILISTLVKDCAHRG